MCRVPSSKKRDEGTNSPISVKSCRFFRQDEGGQLLGAGRRVLEKDLYSNLLRNILMHHEVDSIQDVVDLPSMAPPFPILDAGGHFSPLSPALVSLDARPLLSIKIDTDEESLNVVDIQQEIINTFCQ
jgi:hypothetical protein